MDLDQLRAEWQRLDAKIDLALRFDARILRAMRLRGESWRALVSLPLDLLAVVLVGSFLGDHATTPRYGVPAAILLVAAVYFLASTVRELVLLRVVDWSAPIVAGQEALEAVRRERLRRVRIALTSSPLLWTPLLVVAMKGVLGIDAYAALGWPFVIANAVFGVIATPLLVWAARGLGARAAKRPWLRRLADEISGRNLAAALRELEALRELVKE